MAWANKQGVSLLGAYCGCVAAVAGAWSDVAAATGAWSDVVVATWASSIERRSYCCLVFFQHLEKDNRRLLANDEQRIWSVWLNTHLKRAFNVLADQKIACSTFQVVQRAGIACRAKRCLRTCGEGF
ncbi:hypothetical protein Dimus_020571 [Dionaea muscipula]